MADVVLGCDINSGNDASCQNTVASVIEGAGHKVEKLEIHPNAFASYSYDSKAKGKIGVYLMADSIYSISDLYYGNTSFDYAVFGIRGDLGLPRMSTHQDFQNNPIGSDPDCNGDCAKLSGKTYPQINEITKSKCVAVFGTSCQELGQNILSAFNGGSSTSSTGEEEEDEEWNDWDNFTPHKGEIMEIRPYKEISSISFDKSYDSPTGTGNVNILYSAKDYKILYQGVAMKLKLRRSCDPEWSATGLEDPDYEENEKFFKEHIPTPELLKELGLPDYRKEQRHPSSSASSSTDDTSSNSKKKSDSKSSSSSSSDSSSSSSSSSSGS